MEHTIETEDLQHRISVLRETLEQEKKFIRDVFQSAPVAIVAVSRDNKIQMVNGKAEQILAKPREELLGMSVGDVIPCAEPFNSDKKSSKTLEINMPWNGCALSWKSTFLRDDQGEVIGTMLFGSVFESLSANTIWNERINTIQSFVRTLAHDFNNLLGGVVGYSSLLKTLTEPGDKISSYIDALDTSVKRIVDVTANLTKFSRGGKLCGMQFDINNNLRELCNKWHSKDNQINTDTDLAADLPYANADWQFLEEALKVLLENAAEAMPTGGNILVSTEQMEITGPSPNIINYPRPGTYIKITIKDTGEGMDMETLSKAFMPLFSTRQKGKGAGMGISIAYGIIKKHNGYLTLESRPDEGTVASVYIPLYPDGEAIDIKDAPESKGIEDTEQ